MDKELYNNQYFDYLENINENDLTENTDIKEQDYSNGSLPFFNHIINEIYINKLNKSVIKPAGSTNVEKEEGIKTKVAEIYFKAKVKNDSLGYQNDASNSTLDLNVNENNTELNVKLNVSKPKENDVIQILTNLSSRQIKSDKLIKSTTEIDIDTTRANGDAMDINVSATHDYDIIVNNSNGDFDNVDAIAGNDNLIRSTTELDIDKKLNDNSNVSIISVPYDVAIILKKSDEDVDNMKEMMAAIIKEELVEITGVLLEPPSRGSLWR